MDPVKINGMNVTQLTDFKATVAKDATKGDRTPTVVAHWDGGSRSRVEFKDRVAHIGGDTELNAMQMLLGSLAACDVDLMATHAAFLGLKVEKLSVEVSGHFNVAAYLGIDAPTGSGYDTITYTVRASIPGATPEQIAHLHERCKRSSPVGDTLARTVKMTMEVEINK